MTKIVTICGPTASGKSKVAIELAERFNGEIVNADSMQVYRGMDIGTAKPTAKDRARVAHHLIDILDPDGDYTAARFRVDATKAIDDITGRGKLPFVTGGTGLYIKALTQGLVKGPGEDKDIRERLIKEAESSGAVALHEKLKSADPVSAGRIHPNNLVRVIRALEVFYLTGSPLSEIQAGHSFRESPFDTLNIGLKLDRPELYERINKRAEQMIEAGLPEEVKKLLDQGYSRDLKPMLGLGYKEVSAHLLDGLDLDEAISDIKKHTRRYGKRQMTWFNSMDILWFSPTDISGMITAIEEHLK